MSTLCAGNKIDEVVEVSTRLVPDRHFSNSEASEIQSQAAECPKFPFGPNLANTVLATKTTTVGSYFASYQYTGTVRNNRKGYYPGVGVSRGPGLPTCETQRGRGPDSRKHHTAIQIGYHCRITRYALNDTIRYYFDRDTFDKAGLDSDYALECFENAIRAWEPLPVQFERVTVRKKAFFTIVFSNSIRYPKTLAKSFFPHHRSSRRKLKVYPRAFESQHRDYLLNVFCHELGHIMGLRHEFAPEEETEQPSVCWGVRDPESVMNYFAHPCEFAVQTLDTMHLNNFYNDTGKEIDGFPVVVKKIQRGNRDDTE
ncbi:hypothetical protein TWF696_001054 [Orbilia brochopaga]|uniref:Peptidase M10 metallopeptidase domain-containing protein n=1 Tax=Orbilia brochopaga TaxID=3140254 RepID=A0AAV9VES2_9PEZI